MAANGRIETFGFSTHGGKPDLTGLDADLCDIAETGATHAELSLFAYDLIAGGRLLLDRVRRLEAICARHDLNYTVHGFLAANFMATADLDRHIAACSAMIELCGILGAKVMVHHAGIAPTMAEEPLKQLFRQERHCLRQMGDLAARHDIRIAVETLFVDRADRTTADPARLARQIREVDHPNVVGTLDFSHAYLMTSWRGLDLREAVRAFAPVAGHCHVHDSFGRPKRTRTMAKAEDMAFGEGDLHLPIGWGDIPWDDLLPELAFLPETIFMFEIPPRYRSELKACAETARRLIPAIGSRAD
ncbi:sugar phosphate isomerase/epimerase family protein [Marinivivus vitaminiproducens]|uniref:sugar phosphate isomerase/epimerase family protein n=1 Tax=Marinivivus vitaminiproducens TaxID=3035935 RepID=UPI0027AB4A2D|nr:sugar phosphate isomerase/epimerase [Geminicoccaceae bacterium SCSIO 64248]